MKCTLNFWLYNVGDLKLMICIMQPEIWSKVHSALGVERYKDTNLCIAYCIVYWPQRIYKTLAIQVPSLIPFDSSIVIVLDKKVVTGLQLFL